MLYKHQTMSAFGTPKKAPRAMKMLTNDMLHNYRDNCELYRLIKAGYRFDGSETNILTLRLYMHKIIDVSVLAQVLPQTKITDFGLCMNNISDISGLAQVLPQTQITRLQLNQNNISDVSALAQVLPQTKITYLALGANKISDADKVDIEAVK